jgi:hypothetical protein
MGKRFGHKLGNPTDDVLDALAQRVVLKSCTDHRALGSDALVWHHPAPIKGVTQS